MVIVCLSVFAGTASAQQTAAGIVGQVRDESGGVLPGVIVTATSPALQVKEVSDITNAQGEYRLIPLPIGTYIVTYAIPGFQTVRQEGLRLEIGIVPRLDITLKVGAIEETVTVSGAAPVVDVTATSTSTQFTRETLELTPTSRNGAISLMSQAPGVRAPGRLDVGGGTVGDTPEFKTFGQPNDSYMVMEGIFTSDMRASAQGGNYFDYNAMDEAKVQSISNGPEVPNRGAALIMLTKSGGNAFHGGGQYAYTSHRFESSNIDSALRTQGITSGNPLQRRTDQGADLGGRIVRDKLWFYGAVRYRPQEWLTLGGVKPDGSQANAYRGEIIANEKVSYQLSQSNKLVFWGQWVQKYHYGEAVNAFIAWESRGDRKPPIRSNTWKVEWQGVKGNSLVLSALFGRWTWTGGSQIAEIRHTDAARTAGVPQGLEIRILSDEDHGGGRPSTFDQVTLRQAGTATGGGNWEDIWRYTSKFTLSWYKPDLLAGNHEFKAGAETTPQYSIDPAHGDRGPAGQYRLIFSNGAPLQIDLYNYPAIPQFNNTYTSAYGNDSWTIGRRLTLDLGLRFEHDPAFAPAQGRQAGAWPFTPAQRIDKTPFQTLTSLAPRLYFSYDVMGDARTVVKGGWGRFYKQRLSVGETAIINPFAAATSTYRWRDLNGNRNYDAGEVDLNPNGPDFISSAQPVSGVSNPDEKVPGTDQFAVTLERQLGRDIGVRASGVFIRTFNDHRLLNRFRPFEAYNIAITNLDPGADGVVGNADDPGRVLTYYEFAPALAGRQNESFMFINDPRSAETRKAIDLQVIKRFSSRWQFLTSYSATRNDTVVPHLGGTSRETATFDPNVEINAGDRTWEWIFRASGIYGLPGGVSVSANFNHESGAPQARQVLVRGGQTIPNIVLNAEPLGSIHLPHVNVVDVRLDKAFTLPRGQRVAARVNFYNALNANAVSTRNLRAGTTYLRPTAILRPRIAEFGISYTF
jgi:hypothetical protein